MEELAKGEVKQFKWGKKRGTGEEKKDVEFYESFSYGGTEYCLYDCVLIGDASKPDSSELFVGKIIKLWEHNDQGQVSRIVELLWFFKYSEILRFVGRVEDVRVEDVLPNELFLASGTGVGLTNANHLEAICGKCNVLCISKDIRNPQPSDEEIKLADFLFHRTFDVGSSKILEKIDDKIAGVDVEFIFNRTSCEKKSTVPEERSNKDPDRRDGGLDCCLTSGSRRNGSYRKDQDNEVEKQLTKQKSRLDEDRYNTDSYSLDASPQKKRKLDGSTAVSDVREKSRIREENYSKNLYGSNDMLQKKRELDGSLAVSDGRAKKPQKIRHDGRNDIEPIRSSRDNVNRREVYSQKPSHTSKKQDPRIPKFSEGRETKYATEKDRFKKSNSDCQAKLTEGKIWTDADYRRHYRVFEVTQKPDAEESKWYRELPREENLRCAEERGNLVLLRNLDPAYTSKEVENIVYSAFNEQCTARIIERTSATIPHIGEALVIFKTRDAAKRVIRSLYEGCLLLSNGRTLVATDAKLNPPANPSLRFNGHIKPIARMRQKMGNAVATSHSSQTNSIEFEMALDWELHRDRFDLTWKRVFEKQSEEMKKLLINFNPKLG